MTVPTRKKVLLVGNPNVGKSLVFSRITGVHVISANYPGTTVEIRSGWCTVSGQEYEIIDMPGLYSLNGSATVDNRFVGLLDQADIVINIIDATTLERNLYLTLQLLHIQKPLIICLNIWDETAHKGITIDVPALEAILGVPVVPTSAKSGVGIKDLVAALSHARIGALNKSHTDAWQSIGTIVTRVQHLSHRHHTFLERFSEVTLHPIGGPITALVVLALTFMVVRFFGEELNNAVLEPLYSRWYYQFIAQMVRLIPFGFIKEILIGVSSDPLQSFGILTTGMYIAGVLVFPYFFSFYLVFGLLEDIGYLPRLAVVLDALFHRLGLHGYSSIPIMLGLGCKVPAFLATRTLPGRREKILTVTLIIMSAPCLPQSAMIFSMGMHYDTLAVIGIFAFLFLFAIISNVVLNRLLKGETPELFMEIPSYRIPVPGAVARKLLSRIVEYAVEVFPMIIAGVCIIHILDAFHILSTVARFVGEPISRCLGLPREIASVMVLGFLRKDVSIALLAPFHLSTTQFVIGSIFMALYLPCIASFFTLIKELGIVLACTIVIAVFFGALLAGTLLHSAIVLLG
jgi:ferrous iron transport protein B